MRNRVIIEHIKPQIEGGRYFIKRVVGEAIDVTADIFSDGYDAIRASVLFKYADDKDWTEFEMNPTSDDSWTVSFLPQREGNLQYKIIAWVDHLATWHQGFLKKHTAAQHLDVELKIGEKLLKLTAESYPKSATKDLLATAKLLGNKKEYINAVQTVISEAFAAHVTAFPMKQFVTESPIFNAKVERERALFSAWYELFPRSASSTPHQHGTFKDVVNLLPRIVEFGFDILYLPPIHPIGEINRKGKNNAVVAAEGDVGSPWAIGSRLGGFKDIEPALGTMKDFEHLIKEAAKQGIEIATDLAFQCAPDHPYIQSHPEWFTWRPDGTIMYAENPPHKFQDIVPLNFECADWKNLWEELKNVILFWVKKGIKIFRVDNPHTKPIPFWEWCMAEVHKTNPEVIFLAEAFTRPKIMGSLGKIGYTQSYSYFTWRVTKAEIIAYMNDLTQTESREYYRPNFWPNTPDILPYHLHHRNPNAFFLRYALAGTLSSNYGVYGPVYEFCFNESFHGKEEYMDSEKYEFKTYDWNVRNRITDLMTLLNRIRRSNVALQTTWNIHFSDTSSDKLLSYIKVSNTEGGKNIIWCVANLDTENTISGYVQTPKDLLGITGNVNLSVTDLLNNATYYWRDEWNFVELNPYKSPMHIFKVEVHN
jgi:starch synthase (maltosyl-transferring)